MNNKTISTSKEQKSLLNMNSSLEGKPLSNLGLGTIWFGRKWPMNSEDYTSPDSAEINNLIASAFQAGIRMFDTAAAYGLSEKRLGHYLKANPEVTSQCIIATKWGEWYDLEREESIYGFSADHMKESFARSLKHLPRIDILYIHAKDNYPEVLKNDLVRDNYCVLKEYGKIKYSGLSASNATVLEYAIDNKLLWMDFVQTSSSVYRNRQDIIQHLSDKGIRIVINAPVRELPPDISPSQSYKILTSDNRIFCVLTGTRHHLLETILYCR